MVLHKGRGEDEIIDQAVENVKRLGHTGKVIVKTDNEPALLSLRDGVLQRLELQAIPAVPPQGGTQSNGCMENGVKLLKGMLRVHVLALENKINGKIPTHHPLMTWIVPHAAECVTKYSRGADGKTPYER